MTDSNVRPIPRRAPDSNSLAPTWIPYDSDAERSVLGVAMQWGGASFLTKLFSSLGPEDFFEAEHRTIYRAMIRIAEAGDRVDGITVRDELRRSGGSNDLILLVGALLNEAGSGVEGTRHIKIIRDYARARAIHQEVSKISSAIEAGARPAELGAQMEVLSSLTRRDDSSEGSRVVPGDVFIFDEISSVNVLWGTDSEVLWAKGEWLLIAGPAGVGKSTLAQQLVLRLLGIGDGSLLGFSVAEDPRKVLYLAGDRPPQVRRSLARMTAEEDRPILAERLVVHKGPPLELLTDRPETLTNLAREHGAGIVVLDSLKDVALDLSKDEGGSRLNLALQFALAEGIDVIGLHHPRKSQSVGGPPNKLSDVYGSTWITAGTGSAIFLWGEAGDPVVDFLHLKQPIEIVGPLKIVHDQSSGRFDVVPQVSLFDLVRLAPNGMTAQEAASALFSATAPNDVEKARRKLNALVSKKLLHRREGNRGGASGGKNPTRYYAVTPVQEAL